jgi:hypothetical protein
MLGCCVRIALCPIVFTILLGLTIPAQAGLLALTNGDRISGDIKKVWDGEIYIEPSYSNEFTVDVEAVQYMESEREFDIELIEGKTQTAKLVGVDDDGLQVLEVDGALMSVTVGQVLELQKEEDYFDWGVNVDLSAGINKGNTNSENGRFRTDANLKIGDHRQLLDLTFNRESQDSVSIKEQDLFQYNYNWLFNDPWFAGFTGSYERDPIRDLEGRLIAAGLVGRDFWNSARRFMNAQVGLGYQSEKIQSETNNSSVAIWAFRFRYDLLQGDLGFFHNNRLTYNITGRDNTVLKSSTGAQYEITDLLYATVSLDYDYESQPSDLATNSDLAFLFGLGLEFD